MVSFSVFLFLLLLALGVVIWSDQAEVNFLNDWIADRLGTSAYVWRLFTNNVTPGPATTLASFTEAAWAGYAPVAGNTITWGAASSVAGIAQSTGSPIQFANSSGGPQTAYGVFVTNAAGTKLYYAERDPLAPVSIPVGVPYQYTPRIQSKSIL